LIRKIDVPEYLNPSPNPLQLPTKSSEVQIKGAQPITLEQAIELAERNNRTIEQAKLQLEQSQAALREAEAGLYPSIVFNGDLQLSTSAQGQITVNQQKEQLERDLNSPDPQVRAQARISEPSLRQAFQNTDSARSQGELGLTLNYDLFTSGRRSGLIEAAERQVRSSELQLDQVSSQTRFDVSDAYYQLQDAEAQILINEAAVKSSESNLKDTQAQLDAGLGTKFDVLRVQVELANNKQQLTNAIANREIQRRQLAQRLSLPESVIVVPADKPDEKAGEWPLDLNRTIILAYKNRAELEQQLVQREISEARRKVALSALGPTISLTAQWNFAQVLNLGNDIAANGDGYLFGAQARWSLFDGGAAQAQALQQVKNKEIAESRFAQAREAIRFEVEQAYATLLANQESIGTTQTAIRQAEEAVRLAILRFQAGVGTQTDRINAEADLTRARGNYVSASIGYNRSLAQLRRAVSNLPPDLSKLANLMQPALGQP
jgi:OMF family outer membrane factor